MFLDDLVDVVNVLRGRVNAHRSKLAQNETRTRYALIDPLLEALGWDVRDPAEVVPEFSIGNGRADYALIATPGESPVLVVEAKALGKPLNDGLTQSISYCLQAGIRFLAVTDGEQWHIYEPHKMAPIDQKRVGGFALTDSDNSLAMKMLWLWKGNFTQASPASVPEAPQLSNDPEPKPITGTDRTDAGWTLLSELRPRHHQQPPTSIQFPGGERQAASRWYELQTATVDWLVRSGRLMPENCPLTTDRGTYLVHTSPLRRDGKPFIAPKQISGLWIETSYDAPDHARQARNILKASGVDPSTVQLRVSG